MIAESQLLSDLQTHALPPTLLMIFGLRRSVDVSGRCWGLKVSSECTSWTCGEVWT